MADKVYQNIIQSSKSVQTTYRHVYLQRYVRALLVNSAVAYVGCKSVQGQHGILAAGSSGCQGNHCTYVRLQSVDLLEIVHALQGPRVARRIL